MVLVPWYVPTALVGCVARSSANCIVLCQQVVMSEAKAEAMGLKPLARIRGTVVFACFVCA